MPGYVYIAIEGPIGVGETTLARLLQAELAKVPASNWALGVLRPELPALRVALAACEDSLQRVAQRIRPTGNQRSMEGDDQ